jgi:hypothetical protein
MTKYRQEQSPERDSEDERKVSGGERLTNEAGMLLKIKQVEKMWCESQL